MWHSLKHWRDWAMNEVRPLLRSGPQSQAIHVSYEKAGLVLHDPVVPWNADALIVEAILRLPPAARRKSDYTLHIPDREPIPAESLKPDAGSDRCRIYFRWNAMGQQAKEADLYWKKHRLGQVLIPMLSNVDFFAGLRFESPTVFARIASQSVACRTFVAMQCRGLQATAILRSSTCSLAAITDLAISVRFRNESDLTTVDVPVPLCSSQLSAKQALISAHLPKIPRRAGEWTITWHVGDKPMGSQFVRAISRRQFLQSLRVSDTRFVVVDGKGQLSLRRQIPADNSITRAGPCFFVSSSEVGMAGRCALQVYAQVPSGPEPPALLQQELLVTDGPTPFAPGLVNIADLAQTSAFELRSKSRVLGILPLSPVPSARFNSEGGFTAAPEFPWTPSADEELTERLQRLINSPIG